MEWQTLLERDELSTAKAAGVVLANFREGPIGFPPSYRRVRGPDGDCWDNTDPQRLKECFTTQIGPKGAADEEVDEEDPKSSKGLKIRVPSWTDRILYVHGHFI